FLLRFRQTWREKSTEIGLAIPDFFSQATTRFTNFLGTYSRFFTVLPSIHGLTFSAFSAVARMVASSASAGAGGLSRSLPFTCTGRSIDDSVSFVSSYIGQGRRASDL